MNLSAAPAFARTFLSGYIGLTLVGDGVADVAESHWEGWLWLLFGTVCLWLLVNHLREQSLRGLGKPDTTWTRTDTVNAVIVGLLAAFPLADSIFSRTTTPPEKAAGQSLAVVCAALLADFIVQRRQTVRASAATPPSRPDGRLIGRWAR